MIYWCESGLDIETITLSQFAELHIPAALNPNMSVAKYRSRFELGLSTSVSIFDRGFCSILPCADLRS